MCRRCSKRHFLARASAMRIISFPWKRLYSGDDEELDGGEGGRQSGEPEPGSRSILGENRVENHCIHSTSVENL